MFGLKIFGLKIFGLKIFGLKILGIIRILNLALVLRPYTPPFTQAFSTRLVYRTFTQVFYTTLYSGPQHTGCE